MQNSARRRFLSRLEACFADGSFIKLTLGQPAAAGETPRKLLFRPVMIRGERHCSIVSRFATRDETKNHPFAAAFKLAAARLGTEFLSANLFTESGDAQLELGGKERLRLIPAGRPPAALEHDKARARKVDARAPYLHALEVTDGDGKVRERMGDKFRQIERFVDLLSSAYRESSLAAGGGGGIIMCDMGAGKGYLTFAAYDYFQRIEKITAKVTGVETRPELVDFCNKAALECGFEGLRFVRSTIEDHPLPALDILVALHACDTATDDALFAGVRAGAEIILAAPCCHKEARPQVDRAKAAAPLRDVVRHGIYAERHAEMATDSLRALLLEREGYRVRVSEFVSAEHTAKNVMLIATKRPRTHRDEARAEIGRRIAALKHFYGIKHHRLEELLMA